MFSHRFVENAGRVRAEQARLRCLDFVDAVVAHAEARDDAAGCERLIQGTGVRAQPDDDVRGPCVPDGRCELRFSVWRAQALEIRDRRKQLFDFAIFRFGDENRGPRRSHEERNLTLTASRCGPYSASQST